jgi:hypothetical protein
MPTVYQTIEREISKCNLKRTIIMVIPTTRFGMLKNLLENRVISSKKTTYHCCHIDLLGIVFSESDGTRKVMLPTDLVLEWISAYEFGLINTGMSSRDMRKKMTLNSDWAPFQHGFETHLAAIVSAWSQKTHGSLNE